MDTKIPLKTRIAKTLADSEKPLHIKDIAKEFPGKPESTIRGRLNDNVGKLFERVDKGVYILKWEGGVVGLLNGDARKLDDKFKENSIDLIISDHAWLDKKSHKGGTRNFAASYDCFKYEQEDFTQKSKALKDWAFLVEFLPEKNANNKEYLREIEDMAEKSWLLYFAEVDISGGNSNIWRKKKFISTAYFFTKWEARKLKIWDEKLAKKIKNGEFQHMKKEYMTDFKKVYSEVLSTGDLTMNREPSNFDLRISREEANYILNSRLSWKENFDWFDIMCKEYGDDEDWQEVNVDDLEEWETEWVKEICDDYNTLEIYLSPNNTNKHERINHIIWRLGSINRDVLQSNFYKHTQESSLPSFKKYIKNIEEMRKIYHELWKDEEKLASHERYQELYKAEGEFYWAFQEYMTFLYSEDSYKMGTRTILPEVFIWDNLSKKDKRHESQKPLNTIEEIILQTTQWWENVVEQFAGSFVWAEAIINLWEEGRWWRNYIGLELDKSRVDDAKKYLQEKYSHIKLHTAEDFFWTCSKADQKFVIKDWEVNQYRKLEVIKNRINKDLSKVISISTLQFELENNDSLQAKNFISESGRLFSISFFGNKHKEANRVITIVANKEHNIFEMQNREWKIINKSWVNSNLDESLIKLYDSFL